MSRGPNVKKLMARRVSGISVDASHMLTEPGARMVAIVAASVWVDKVIATVRGTGDPDWTDEEIAGSINDEVVARQARPGTPP